MTNRETAPPWSESDYAFLADHTDWTARRVAEALNRTTQSVYTKRWRLAQGWQPVAPQVWDPNEDEAILAAGPYATVSRLADRLPGRTPEAISTRRRRLGVESVNSNHKRPEVIGARPLIAKTCIRCGLLLQANWFDFVGSLREWRSTCRKCTSKDALVNRHKRGDKSTEEQHRAAKRSLARYQSLTVGRARRSGEPYTEQDHTILADPDLTIFQKALRLERSYAGTRTACSRGGYRSHVGLGDPDRDQWIIDNPNAQAS